MVEIPVERLRRQSKLAVHIRYGFPLSLRIRKGSQPPKKYWSKMNRTQDRTKADDQIRSRDVEKSDGARNTASAGMQEIMMQNELKPRQDRR